LYLKHSEELTSNLAHQSLSFAANYELGNKLDPGFRHYIALSC